MKVNSSIFQIVKVYSLHHYLRQFSIFNTLCKKGKPNLIRYKNSLTKKIYPTKNALSLKVYIPSEHEQDYTKEGRGCSRPLLLKLLSEKRWLIENMSLCNLDTISRIGYRFVPQGLENGLCWKLPKYSKNESNYQAGFHGGLVPCALTKSRENKSNWTESLCTLLLVYRRASLELGKA